MARVVDPVCRMEFDKTEAKGQSTHLRQTYYFCSEECKRVFDENPTEYFGNVSGEASGPREEDDTDGLSPVP